MVRKLKRKPKSQRMDCTAAILLLPMQSRLLVVTNGFPVQKSQPPLVATCWDPSRMLIEAII
jgi:hypothetical protein